MEYRQGFLHLLQGSEASVYGRGVYGFGVYGLGWLCQGMPHQNKAALRVDYSSQVR